MEVTSGEDGAGWLAFFRGLVAPRLDRHRARHLRRPRRPRRGDRRDPAGRELARTTPVSLMSMTPKSSWPWVRTLLHSVYDQADATAVHEPVRPGPGRAERQALGRR